MTLKESFTPTTQTSGPLVMAPIYDGLCTTERLAQVQRLLESTVLPVECIPTEVGFGTVQALRNQFQERLGVAPKDFRKVSGEKAPT